MIIRSSESLWLSRKHQKTCYLYHQQHSVPSIYEEVVQNRMIHVHIMHICFYYHTKLDLYMGGTDFNVVLCVYVHVLCVHVYVCVWLSTCVLLFIQTVISSVKIIRDQSNPLYPSANDNRFCGLSLG
jgi:hypothetical protein